MVVDRLQFYLDNCSLISERQAGFRRDFNTTEQIVRLTQHIKDGFQAKQSTIAAFVDFKSAFDRVWRKMLLKKLLHMKISGHLFKWISDFLSQRFININFGSSRSGFGQTRQGLPQGSVLSPVLFNIMINDLTNFIEKAVPGVKSLLYADDLVLWSTSSDISSLEISLNKALEVLEKWTFENEFEVNSEKTTFELFTLSTKKHDIKLVYKDKSLHRTDCATYLGINLDTKLTWTKHINKVVDKVTSRFNLLKRIAGVKWGASQSVLVSTFNSYIRPVFDYGAELFITASDSALTKLDIAQNRALRLITGAANSTPIAAMQLQTEIYSLTDRRIYSALSLGERLLRKEFFWHSYVPSRIRLKTQNPFLFEFHQLTREFDLSYLRQPIFKPPLFPGILKFASANLDLVQPVRKQISIQAELKASALATIHERYPIQNWLHVYTDGSATTSSGKAGAGAYSKFFSLKEPLSTWSDNFDGEIYAIFMALRAVTEIPHQNIVLFVDSQAAIQVITDYSPFPSETEFKCKKLIDSFLSTGSEVVLQWIPSHCGIHGNEQADLLAKEASALHPPCLPIPLRNAKRLLKSKIRQRRISSFQEMADGKTWACLLDSRTRIQLSLLPRVEGVTSFRLITGHDYLQAHLFRIGLAVSPLCLLCGSEPMTGEHLFSCPYLIHVRDSEVLKDLSRTGTVSHLYWTARRLMSERTFLAGVI
jgi:ribonuclease HI